MKISRWLSPPNDQDIQRGVSRKFRGVARKGPEGYFHFPIGEDGLKALSYPPDVLSLIPDDVKQYFCGVGNPINDAGFSPGKRVLDVGCGAGVDAIIAATVAGPESEVTGVDMVQEMVDLAMKNAAKAGIKNVSFVKSSGDALPFPNGHFDILLSNGVFNLMMDKEKAISEWFRVLAGGGEAVIADMSLEDGVTEREVTGKGAWSD